MLPLEGSKVLSGSAHCVMVKVAQAISSKELVQISSVNRQTPLLGGQEKAKGPRRTTRRKLTM